ncbi:MAG: 30S ribosomal protein S8 [bacterium]|nr:30S ribosomal protein S8 [bacterium]
MDPIADMLVNIKNTATAGKSFALVPYSKLKFSIASILVDEGYLKSVAKRGKKAKKFIELEVTYDIDKKPKISGVSRISRPSKRVYYGTGDVRPVRNGHGLLVLSTPKGILTGKDARKEHVGGEALFKIW